MARRVRLKRDDTRLAGGEPAPAKTSEPFILSLPVLFVLVSGLIVGTLFAVQFVGSRVPPPGPKTAAIVDQLSLTFPNPGFVETTTDMLEEAGYEVDYYPGEEVTVELYRRLPTHGYDLIILRVHSGQLWHTGQGGDVTQKGYVSLFTGEPYRVTKYVDEQRDARVIKAAYHEGSDPVFAIAPRFVEGSMQGSLDDAVVVLMGCDGLGSRRTAQAFLDLGARAFVGWDDEVSAAHTDAATEALIRQLLTEDVPVEEAVARTMREVGPDPAFDAELNVLAVGG